MDMGAELWQRAFWYQIFEAALHGHPMQIHFDRLSMLQ